MTENYSYATKRKINIINERLGDGYQWPNVPSEYEGMSIDSLYSHLIGDNRVNLFFKVDPKTKEYIDLMSKSSGMKKAEFIEFLINEHYKTYNNKIRKDADDLLKFITRG